MEQEHQRVADNALAAGTAVGDLLTVEDHRKRALALVVPLGVGDLGAAGQEPGDVLASRAVDLLPDKETVPAQHWLGAAEGDQAAHESEHRLVGPGPVDPRELVVLAVGVVVAGLGAAQLVAVGAASGSPG